jgi:hypothetical protein
METATLCFNCGKPLSIPPGGIVSRSEECESCRVDVRTCRNCKHFNPKAYNECNESQAERVVEKEKANFCDFFYLVGGTKTSSDSIGKDDIKSKFDALFK